MPGYFRTAGKRACQNEAQRAIAPVSECGNGAFWREYRDYFEERERASQNEAQRAIAPVSELESVAFWRECRDFFTGHGQDMESRGDAPSEGNPSEGKRQSRSRPLAGRDRAERK